ncbi:MAG: cytochrome b N-terminal domain-containing protein [Deferrisomatales bacterium]|nr:cytochrome b N-terminal domain-containing protein [Deferrisomatales bacterium]
MLLLLLGLVLSAAHVLAHSEAHETEAGHSAVGFGYVGLEPEGLVDPADLEEFTERVTGEAYAKARLDGVRLVALTLVLAGVFAAYGGGRNARPRWGRALEWDALGTTCGMLLLFAVVPSGAAISFFYNPSPWQTYASVEGMAARPILAFLRNLHTWSSELLLALMLVHAAKTVSSKGYLGRRKVIWLTGALLFVVLWLNFVAGSFLRGDQEALEGFQHVMYALSLVPLGEHVARFFSGEPAVMRLFSSHVTLTLAAGFLLLTLHVLMRQEYVHVQKHWKVALAYSAALGGLLVLQSTLQEAPLVRGLAAGPAVTGIEITKPPWPLYFLVAGENLFGAAAMAAAPVVVFLPFVLFPYLVERLPGRGASRARVGEAAFYAGCLAILGLSLWAAASPIVPHIF